MRAISTSNAVESYNIRRHSDTGRIILTAEGAVQHAAFFQRGGGTKVARGEKTLRIILLKDLPPLPHPGPSTIRVDRGVGLELPAATGKLHDESGNVACVLEPILGGGAGGTVK